MTVRSSSSTAPKQALAAASGPAEASATASLWRSLRARWRAWLDVLERELRQPRTVPLPRWITPRHHTTTISEGFGHGSFLLVAASYAVDDYLLLRVIAVAGSTSMLFFTYFHPHGRVLWLPFQWNVAFIVINLYRIGSVRFERWRAEQLSPEWIQFRNRNFYLMDPGDFAVLVEHGKVVEHRPGDVIVSQGDDSSTVGLVLEGTAKVFVDGQLTYLLSEANFVHESGLHAGLLLPGKIENCCTVLADTSCRLLVWDRTDLVALMHRRGGVRRSLKAVLSWDIVRKLKQQRSLLTTHTIEDAEEWTDRRNRQTHYRYRAILRNMCQHPDYLKERRKQLLKYRMIHNIGDDDHLKALEEIGWTVQEFEAGRKEGAWEEHDDDLTVWQKLYIRLFGSTRDFD
jgi:CRP-like cAMP-binding protein